MIIAIDFDGTIVDHDYPLIGKLKVNAKQTINKLYDMGIKIIIWTCRYLPEDLESMKQFLDDTGIKYNKINKNVSDAGFCPYPKIVADIYIDDRNLFCQGIDWIEIEKYFDKMIIGFKEKL